MMRSATHQGRGRKGWGMRLRAMAIVFGVLVMTAHAGSAATTTVLSSSLRQNGELIVVNSVTGQVLYHPGGTTAMKIVNITCLKLQGFPATIVPPVGPPIAAFAFDIYTSGKTKSGERFYFHLVAIGRNPKGVLATIDGGARKTPSSYPCGGPYIVPIAPGVTILQ